MNSAAESGLRTRGFLALMATQGFTVLNDNLFKQVVLLLALDFQIRSGFTGPLGDLQASTGMLFAIPFLLFASLSGDLADRFSKRRMILIAKWAEIGVMLLAALAFAQQSFEALAIVLFLMGMQSALLGPAKYGALVELLPRRTLGRGNGIMQAVVLGAILLGMGSAGLLKTNFADQLWILGLGYALIACLGTWMAYSVPHLPPADPQRKLRFNPLGPAREGFRMCGQIPGLPPAIFGHALYWFIGAVLLFSWNEMGEKILNVEQGAWTAKLATLSVSTALGCIVAGRACKERIPVLLPRLGGWALAASFFAVAMGPQNPTFIWTSLAIGSFFAGWYLIPLRTLIQRLPDRCHTGRALGISQFSDWTGIVLASFAKSAMASSGLDAIQVFWVLGTLLAMGTWAVTNKLDLEKL